MKSSKSKHYTKEQRDWIFENHGPITIAKLTEKFNKHFGEDRDPKSIQYFCWRNGLRSKFNQKKNAGSFKKGSESWNKGKKGYMGANKTSFKAGATPHNYKPVGSERITSDGYVMIKVKDPKTWKLKHRVIWEKEHGPIPRDSLLNFIDGNALNCSLENLALITRKEHALMTVSGLQQATGNLRKVAISHVRLKSLLIDKNSNKNQGVRER